MPTFNLSFLQAGDPYCAQHGWGPCKCFEPQPWVWEPAGTSPQPHKCFGDLRTNFVLLADWQYVAHVKLLIEEYKKLLVRSECDKCHGCLNDTDKARMEYLKTTLEGLIE